MSSRNYDKQLPTLAPGPHVPTRAKSTPLPRPKKNSTACQPCKQAKRKCSGPPSPCRACEGSDSECVFDESLDLRRKVAVRRTITELEDSRDYYRHLLLSLLASLRSPEQDRVNRILDLIHGNASLPDIAAVVTKTPSGASDSRAADATSGGGSEDVSMQSPSNPFVDSHFQVTMEMLCDIPLFKVPAKPWTAVTDDDHLISHLISLYFTWHHPFSQLVDQSTFLEEMVKGDLNSELCTPFLVNSMLAMASAYSDFPKVLAIHGDRNTRGQHFYSEAERLWKAEEGKATLLNIQGVILMCQFLRYQGKDRLSWLMLKQGIQLALDFGMFRSRGKMHRNQEEMRPEISRVSVKAAWEMFILNAQMSLEMRVIADLAPPPIEPYTPDDPAHKIVWAPYPRTNQISHAEKPALLWEVMTEVVEFSKIVIEIESLLFDEAFDIEPDHIWSAVNRIYSRIRIRLECLPSSLKIGDFPIPQTLFVRIKYHQSVISLFSLFLDHFGGISLSWSNQARRTRIQSAKQIATYLRAHWESYGPKQIPCDILDAVYGALITLLVDLDDDESIEAFVELCRFLGAFRQRLQQAENMIQMLEGAARESSIKLPSKAISILELVLTPTRPGSDPH